jgi:hypothetical protein
MKKKKTNSRKKTRKELEQMTFKDHLSSITEAANELKVLITDLVKRGEERIKGKRGR